MDARHRAPASPVPDLVRTIWVSWVPFVAIGLGALARLRQWAGGRSLWLDEVLIADNLVHRGFGQLLTDPLAHSQTAPLLWLWIERVAVDVFGSSERALRLLPLLAGLGVLWLTLLLARQVLPRVLVPVPVLLVALHPGLVYYANEVKQYSTDVLVVLVLLLLAFKVPSRTADGTPLRRFSAAAAVAVWASHPSVFVLAALSLVLVLRPLIAGDNRRALRVGLVLSPWLVSLLVSYLLVLRATTENAALFAYWGYSFPHGFLDLPAWFGRRAVGGGAGRAARRGRVGVPLRGPARPVAGADRGHHGDRRHPAPLRAPADRLAARVDDRADGRQWAGSRAGAAAHRAGAGGRGAPAAAAAVLPGPAARRPGVRRSRHAGRVRVLRRADRGEP
ncbi:MAG: hypothetical protein LC789_07820 [Actinobacteria bacterium]|nr:hypothetical protein [Actinomycetota bacterium]